VSQNNLVRSRVARGRARKRHVGVRFEIQSRHGTDASETRAVRQRVQQREEDRGPFALGRVQVERGFGLALRSHRVRLFRPTVQIGRASKIEQH